MRPRSILLSGLAAVIAAGAFAVVIAACRAGPPTGGAGSPPAPRQGAPAPPAAGAGVPGAVGATGALPVLWPVPPFAFPDQHGKPAAAADLRGHVWIANFIFTQCTTVCPLITAKMTLLQRRLRGRDLRFVSFSVDPEHDTPAVLKQYATRWRADEPRWILLSTTPADLERLAAGMYVSVKPSENDINHTRMFFLVDGSGSVRGIYESDRNDAVERLVRDTEALAGGSPAEPPPREEVATGSELYTALGCGACHARRELAPPLEGLSGRRVKLEGGGELEADAAYIREAIVAPDARIVAGYATRMPSYERELTPRQLDALVEHVRTLAAPADRTGRLAATTEPARNAVDPVCSMKVRVIESTPRTTHAGHAYYFCSERCRDRFTAEPVRYTKLAKR